ncbi:trichohyalin-like isoform X2 [Phymastichus coffea]|uniref:trichohyalin-like isoform X2 n=1 Tax=Phymastichus coffea TaxID=108790 RepID=UPI00273CBCC1|nr:trichohyalin-like isoform X2 [Phymastichus coffea]
MPGAGGQQPQRTTFRPPWVKDGGPQPIPMPTAPWTLNSRRDSTTHTDEAPAFTKIQLKSVSKSTDVKPADISSSTSSSREGRQTATAAPSNVQKNGRTEPTSRPQLERQTRLDKSRSRSDHIALSKSESTTGAPTLSKSASRANVPPPPPPRPPPPPPARTVLKDLPPLSDKQQKTLEMLKSRPRKRPDWACMMKEVESGKKLRHVTCNDRSAPIIERVKVTKVADDPAGSEHFVFDSEKSNPHNKLLKQIQEGVKLKKVITNDRSKPILEGLRKFRRQLTIEEQIQKAEQAPIEEEVPDEMDDIDAIRDDLQSTKQMLALELRNKEALERENRRLQARILNLEVELERERSQKTVQEYKQQDQKLANSLKKEAKDARQDAERLEKEFAIVAEERDKAKIELEEMKAKFANLEKRMKVGMALAGCPSAKDVAKIASQKSMEKTDLEESEEEEEYSEEESEEDDQKNAEEKRQLREIKLMKIKVKNFKDKTINSKKERQVLKVQIKQQQNLLKEENKKFKGLQKEVDKMAKLMAGDNEENDEEEDEEDEEEEEEETESEEESESEESEEDDFKTDDENAPIEKRKEKLQNCVKRHEGRLAALKKGNYLLKAQVDRLKDDLAKQREESISLQEDLDSVLAELG